MINFEIDLQQRTNNSWLLNEKFKKGDVLFIEKKECKLYCKANTKSKWRNNSS